MILDTNALSALADGDQAAAALVARTEVLAIPVIALGEFGFGIAQSTRAEGYQKWLEEFANRCLVLEIDEQTARWYARIQLALRRAGTPIPANDAWIAATCLQRGFPVLSRDRHFDRVHGVQRIPW